MINKAMVKKKLRRVKKEIEYKDSWDRNCTRKKRQVKKIYRRWRQ